MKYIITYYYNLSRGPIPMLKFDFTEKAEETVQAATQLAKDYAHVQGMLFVVQF